MFKRLLCLLLALILLCFSVGCDTESGKIDTPNDKEETVEKTEYKDTISLLFCDSDTLNPYTAQTEINRQLCRLIFEPLVKTDNEFNAVYRLADSVKVKGKECTVTLKDAFFSDGSRVKASDVVYSFKLAKDSKTSYFYKLYNVKNATAKGEKTIKFSLEKNDPYCENVLDFPILKAKSDKRTDSDGVVLPCISSGRYIALDDYSKLVSNDKFNGENGSIKTVNLQIAPDSESISHYIEIGAADMYYTDISDGNIIRMSADKHSINLNNLVYIGINSSYGMLGNSSLRYAISSALNRNAICSNAYYNNALAATGFFNPLWRETASVQNIQTTANLQITVENLSEIGYNRLDEEGYYVNSSGNRINLTLLVNSDNSMRVTAANEIAAQLKNAGIRVTVIKQSYKKYIKSLKSGNFQLYLGEVNITSNMDLSPLVTKGSGACYGLPKKAEKKQEKTETEVKPQKEQFKSPDIIKGFYNGVNTINDVATSLQTELPCIPVCFRTGVLFCDESIENVENSSVSDIYFSIESYLVKEK